IHHLKENEAHNIEKWMLEKLLIDQTTSDLQVQLDEIHGMWEEERAELEAVRAGMNRVMEFKVRLIRFSNHILQ
ncbi:hypothetical protein DFH08DRAFT_724275, partial [Mycena albidolilacea]